MNAWLPGRLVETAGTQLARHTQPTHAQPTHAQPTPSQPEHTEPKHPRARHPALEALSWVFSWSHGGFQMYRTTQNARFCPETKPSIVAGRGLWQPPGVNEKTQERGRKSSILGDKHTQPAHNPADAQPSPHAPSRSQPGKTMPARREGLQRFPSKPPQKNNTQKKTKPKFREIGGRVPPWSQARRKIPCTKAPARQKNESAPISG